MRPLPRSREGGFTLVELMITVAILAVLVTVAVMAYTRHIKRSRLVEAQEMLGKIQMRQEAYYQANGTYCDASGDSHTFHPTLPTAGGFVPLDWAPTSLPGWAALGARVESGVTWFSYVVVAGQAPDYVQAADAAALGVPAGRPWYYAIARADMDGNGAPYTELNVTSFRPSLVTLNEGQ